MFHTEYTQRRLVIQIYLFGLKFDGKASLLLYRTYPEKTYQLFGKFPLVGPGFPSSRNQLITRQLDLIFKIQQIGNPRDFPEFRIYRNLYIITILYRNLRYCLQLLR